MPPGRRFAEVLVSVLDINGNLVASTPKIFPIPSEVDNSFTGINPPANWRRTTPVEINVSKDGTYTLQFAPGNTYQLVNNFSVGPVVPACIIADICLCELVAE